MMTNRIRQSRREFLKALGLGAAAAALALPRGVHAAEAGAPPAKKPNILFLFSDQHNADVLGCAGHAEVKTPNFDRLAREGTRFARAYCQDAICVPSRVAIFTGLYPRTTGVLTNGDPLAFADRVKPLQAVLKAAGYQTAAFGKRHLPAGGPKDSIDTWDVSATTISPKQDVSDEDYETWVRAQGLGAAYDRDFGGNKSPLLSHVSDLPADKTSEAYTAAKTIEFLRTKRKPGQPFFLWCSFQRPHQPYTPPAEWAKQYDPAKVRLPESLREPPEHLPPMLQRLRQSRQGGWCLGLAAEDEKLYRTYIACYYALVAEMDHYVGAILDTLKELGLDEDTIIIYAADHGDFVGRHGIAGKAAMGHNVYEETLRVPLIVRYPARVRQGIVSSDLVELVDLYPTILDLAGVLRPEGYRLAGRSLVPAMAEGKPVGRKFAVSENWSQIAIIGEWYKLAVWQEPPAPPDGGPRRLHDYRSFGDMLFDREKDPQELCNLAGKPEVAQAEKELREALAVWIAGTPAEGKAAVAPKGWFAKQYSAPKAKAKKG
jgi:arylsulfatase A-like enzyme